MRNLYVYAADRADEPYSELALAERPDRDGEGRRLFAVFESPMMEEVYGSVLRLIRWGRDPADGSPANGTSDSARILCVKIQDALMHLVNVPFTCRRAIDTEFADDGDETYRHGMRSMALTCSPSSAPLSATSA